MLALTENKKTETYERVLTACKNRYPELNPKEIITDFERAEKNAIEKVYPEAKLRSCYFHYGQVNNIRKTE